MKDFHTHIGPYYEAYYDFKDVFSALKNNGIESIVCAYLTPKFSEGKDALKYYKAVLEELKQAHFFAKKIDLKVDFLHWADPLLFKDKISLSQIFEDFFAAAGEHYSGIALHPGLHNWSNEHCLELTKIFEFAKDNSIPLFIHTGVSECDEPLQFEKWFAEFPEVKVQLAHCKNTEQILYLFSKYENLVGDTAFCPQDSYETICEAGFKDRMFFGTDFPITHWYEHFKEDYCSTDEVSLTDSYKRTLNLYNDFSCVRDCRGSEAVPQRSGGMKR